MSGSKRTSKTDPERVRKAGEFVRDGVDEDDRPLMADERRGPGDLVRQAASGSEPAAGERLRGIAYRDAETGRLLGAAPKGDRTDGSMFLGIAE